MVCMESADVDFDDNMDRTNKQREENDDDILIEEKLVTLKQKTPGPSANPTWSISKPDLVHKQASLLHLPSHQWTNDRYAHYPHLVMQCRYA